MATVNTREMKPRDAAVTGTLGRDSRKREVQDRGHRRQDTVLKRIDKIIQRLARMSRRASWQRFAVESIMMLQCDDLDGIGRYVQ
jgi:hypothetical protein